VVCTGSDDYVACSADDDCCTGSCIDPDGSPTCGGIARGGDFCCGRGGAPCTDDECCCTGVCTGGLCAACKISGLPCTDGQDSECCSGNCVNFPGLGGADYCSCVGNTFVCSQHSQCCSGRCENSVCVSQIGLGELCDEGADCLSGSCFGGVPSVCQCLDNADCGTNAVCNESENPNACQACPNTDALCNANSDCCSGRCDNGDTCQPRLANGQACNANNDCISDSCAGTNVCQCNDNGDCASGEYCNTVPNPNVCAPQLANGQACDEDSDCASGRCDGMCMAKLADGVACNEDSDCISGRCDTTCMAKLSYTSACNEDSDCLSGMCVNPPGPDPVTCNSVSNAGAFCLGSTGETCISTDACCASGICLGGVCT